MAQDFDKTLGPLPTSVVLAGSANVALLLPPILAQIQLMLTGAFGLGPLQLDLLAQFNAAIQFNLSFGLNPLAALKLSISASLQVIASLQATLAAGLTLSLGLSLNLQVGINLALIANLQLKIGGINLLIDLSLQIRLGGINFLAQLQAALSLGNVVLYSWSDKPMTTVQSQIAAWNFSGDGFLPAQPTYGILLATAAPGASASFRFLFNPALPA